ncbi:uncharacterized protein [Apostichopus japonicus]|uniref:uncharacterized protein isoform X2 n=1 Tax=Stichopus japonicus TaxID=307972 RepID=UPI003AB56EA8
MERKKFFHLFHMALILIDMTDAGKLCDFAAKFPCKGSHCLPSPCKSKTMQESEEPTTTVTTEPQGTTLGKTMQESEEPTTTVTTEPQGTTLGSSIYTCPPNMIYGNCTCEATCEDPKGESACNSTCLGSTGCICKAGLMLNGTDCISASRCSCFVTEANLVISNGKTYVNDNCTQKCSCSNNRLICEDDYSCSTNAVCDVKNEVRQCYCNEGYEGDGETCEPLYTDCQDVYDAGHRQDGVYTIMPTGWPGLPFNVSCKMENGGGWTVFQRRTDGSTSFYQNWTAYKEGFGDSRNLWLGNEKLHYLTNQRNYKLLFDITTSSGSAKYAEYPEFQIDSESSNYTMNKLADRSSGNTGSQLDFGKGKQFSTHDRDNDACGHYHCAEKHRSGWWHGNASNVCNSCHSMTSYCDRFQYNGNCHSVCTNDNLNGDYNGGNGENIFSEWFNNCNVSSVEMKIRPSS